MNDCQLCHGTGRAKGMMGVLGNDCHACNGTGNLAIKGINPEECDHSNMRIMTNVIHIQDDLHKPVNERRSKLDIISVQCADCGTDFEFVGMSAGAHDVKPTVSFDGLEARLNIKPSRLEPGGDG